MNKSNEAMNKLKASAFINKLDKLNFIDLNQKSFMNYIRSSKHIALANIRASYIKLVCEEGWSERKFADITYIIARDGELYNCNIYQKIEKPYHARELNMDILKERARYEKSAQEQLNKALKEKEEEEHNEEEDLLRYIAAHGGRA